MWVHLDETTIALLIEQRLGGERVHEVQRHIDSCDECRTLLAELARASPRLAAGSTKSATGRERERVALGERIGRYEVLKLVGSGAMGAVFAARDPDLDRKVALKLLHRGAAASELERARMLREAQALARVADRGVVAVHDVGSHDDQIYIAMEFVTGGTLRAWLVERPRSWRAILAVALAAGRGLAAAHAAGLVHRDVKPDNILVDAQGVARIGDFGLAAGILDPHDDGADLAVAPTTSSPLPELTVTGAVVGTPAYMAPEQLAGRAVTPRSDQFSFCITVFEALYGVRPFTGATIADLRRAMQTPAVVPAMAAGQTRIPRHVRRALGRGLAIDPERRFPSITELLGALDPAPRRRRAIAIVAAAAGAAVVAAGVVVARSMAPATDPCAGGARKLAGIWDAARKAEIERAFRATGEPYATDAWRGVERALDALAADWTSTHRATCEATRVHGDQSERVLELRMACLDDRLRDVRALTESLREADAAAVARAVPAANKLPSLEICADVRALSDLVPPRDAASAARIDGLRDELSRARALSKLGQFQQGYEIAKRVAESSAREHYPPLEAEALLEQGFLGFALESDAKAAEDVVVRALLAADKGRHDHLRARAWVVRYHLVGAVQQRLDDAAGIYQHATAAVARLAGAEAIEAGLLANHGQILTIEAKYDEAIRALERSLALLEKAKGPDHPETARALATLSDVYARVGNNAKSLALAKRAYETHARTMGTNHPEVAKSLFTVAHALEDAGNYDEAAETLGRVIAMFEASLGKYHLDLAPAVDELGIVRRKQHKLEEALALHQRALALREKGRGPEHPETAISYDNVGVLLSMLSRDEEALGFHQRALVVTEKAFGVDHPESAASHGHLANTYLGLKRTREALAAFRRALVVTEKALGPDAFDLGFYLSGIGHALLDLKQPADAIAPLERALRVRADRGDPMARAEIEFALARALWSTNRDRARARQLADKARPHYQAAGQREVEDWLKAGPARR